MKKKISIASDSHPGLVRDENQDSCDFVVDNGDAMAVLADGVGGHHGGEIASAICVETFINGWLEYPENHLKRSADVRALLRALADRANENIRGYCAVNDIAEVMGTTLVAGIFKGEVLTVIHAGDSRCYAIEAGRAHLLTEDHSLVNEMLKRGLIRPEEAENHPCSHIICRSLGPSHCPAPWDISAFPRRADARYVLCSDGLNLHVNDRQIAEICTAAKTPEAAAKKLVRQALSGGGGDNVTAMVVFDERV